MIRRAVTVTKWLSLSITSVIILTLAAVAFLLFTNSGLNSILWGAEKALPTLKVQQTQGAIFPRFTLQGIQFQDESLGVDLKADTLTLAINHRCFLSPQICVDELSADQLQLVLTEVPSEELPETESEPLTQVSTPLPITLYKLALTNVDVDVYGTSIKWETLNSSATFEGRLATLGVTLLQNSQLSLPEQEPESSELASVELKASESEPASTTSDADQAIVLPEVWIPLDVVIEQIEIDNFTLEQEAPFVVHHLGLSGKAGGHDVTVSQLALDIDEVSAVLTVDVMLKDDYPLQAQLDGTAKLAIAAGEQVSLKLEGSVAELSLALTTKGVNKIDLTGNVKPLEPTFPFDVKIKDSYVQWPLVTSEDYSVVITHLQGSGSLDSYQTELSAEIKGNRIPDLAVTLDGRGTVDDIDLKYVRVDTLGGHVEGQVSSQWKDLVKWYANVELESVQPGLYWPEAEGSISGKLETTGGLTDEGGWFVELPTLDIRGIVREYPLDLEGSLTASDRSAKGAYKLNTPGLKLGHGPNQLNVVGKLDKQWGLDIDLSLADLSKSVPDTAGSVQGNIILRGELAEPDVGLLLSASNIQWQDIATLQALKIDGNLLPATDPKVALNITAQQLTYDSFSAEKLEIGLDGSLTEHQLAVDLDSELIDLSLALSGDFQQQANIWEGALSSVQITTEQGPWRLNRAVNIAADLTELVIQMTAHCWVQASSSLCLNQDIEVSQQSGDASLSVNGFDFAQVKQYIPEDTKVEGSVDVNVDATWQDGNVPDVKAQVLLTPGRVTQQLDEPLSVAWQASSLKAEFSNNRVEGEWNIDIKDNGDLIGQVLIPDVLAEDRTLDGELKLTPFNLDFLSPLIGDYSNLGANLSADIQFSGPVMQPKVDGYFKVEQMKLSGDISPLTINSGQVDLDFNGYQATLDALIKTAEGDLNIKGDADWEDLASWHSDIRVFADGLVVEVPPMVKVRVEPDMTISMSPSQAKVQGDIHLPWARIDVQSLPDSAVGVSSDQVILDENLQPINDESAMPFALETDVNIHIGDDFKLSAFGLSGSLEGKLNVAQRDRGPLVNGEVNIVDGSYSSFGQDLLIDEGKILMNGPVDQPYIVITAIRNPDNTEDDVTAGIRVTGPADEPIVEIFSEPAMPQANALSYLLRGQDIDGESGGNAITTTLIGLSLARSGKVVGEIGEAFGVQDLQLDTAGTGDDSQVTVSGYILPGLQVKYGVGIFDSVGEFTVRYRLMKDLYIEVVSGLDSAVDVLYQFEFD